MSMLERVARAMIVRIGSPWPYEKMPDEIKLLWLGHAWEAIAAMRNLPDDPGARYDAGEYSRRNIEAMVDDALVHPERKA